MELTKCQQEQAAGLVAGVLILSSIALIAVLCAYVLDFSRSIIKEIRHAMQSL